MKVPQHGDQPAAAPSKKEREKMKASTGSLYRVFIITASFVDSLKKLWRNC